jgi:hypothetical protein
LIENKFNAILLKNNLNKGIIYLKQKLIMYRKILITLIVLFLVQSCDSQTKIFWPEITHISKPWTRWWWLGSAVDQRNLDYLLNQYQKNGFGGVEITPLYGVKNNEQNDINFLSPKWKKMLDYTITKSQQLGLGVDMNCGTGWPFGGAMVTKEFGAKKVRFILLNNCTVI